MASSTSTEAIIHSAETWETAGHMNWTHEFMKASWEVMTVATFILSVAEDAPVAPSIGNAVSTALKDAWGMDSHEYRTIHAVSATDLGIVDAEDKEASFHLAEDLGVCTSLANDASSELADSFDTCDVAAKDVETIYETEFLTESENGNFPQQDLPEGFGVEFTELVKGVGQNIAEDMPIEPTIGNSASMFQADGFGIAGGYVEKMPGKEGAETFGVSNAVWRNDIGSSHESSFMVESQEDKTPTSQQRDNFGLVDALPEKSFEHNTERLMGLGESIGNSAKSEQEELLLVEQEESKSVTTPQSDSFGVQELPIEKAFEHATERNLGVNDGDLIVRGVIADLPESLLVDPTIGNGATSELNDSFGVTGDAVDNFAGKFSETELAVTDQEDKFAESSGHHSSFGVETTTFSDIGKDHAEDLLVEDGHGMTAASRQTEALAVEGEGSNMPGVFLSEEFQTTEGFWKFIGQDNAVTLEIAEVMLQKVEFFRTYEESVHIKDEPAKQPMPNFYNSLSLVERMIIPAWMVIADISALALKKGQEYTHRDFLANVDKLAMPGWTPWRNYLHGDYEYSRAVFRIVMESVTDDRAYLETCELAVDVPDVIDRGTARISDANAELGGYVEFMREYHVIPEINLTARGGVGSNPVAAELMGSPTLLGFSARLRDTVTGEYVGGSFTWTSIGY